jgi:hypothetical protein
VEALRIDINTGENGALNPKVMDFRALAEHYIIHELSLDQSEAAVEKAYSTIVTNRRYLRLWIGPLQPAGLRGFVSGRVTQLRQRRFGITAAVHCPQKTKDSA